MSIDPIGCQDVDDALGVKILPNGNIQLGGQFRKMYNIITSKNLNFLYLKFLLLMSLSSSNPIPLPISRPNEELLLFI